MRITNQMQVNSSIRSGNQTSGSSLLEKMNQNNGASSVLSQITKKNTTTAVAKTNYTKLEKSAESLVNSTKKLQSTDKASLFAKAAESKSTKDVVSTVKDLVDQYNTTLKQLKTTGGNLNISYMKQLKKLPADCKTALSSVGITQATDGTLTVNTKTLESADLDKLKQIFNGTSGFMKKLNNVSTHIETNATAYLSSSSNQYTSKGTSTNSSGTSKYNSLG